MKVVDLYNEPTLFVRSPEADAEQKINFPSDDPYFSEISAWIDASEKRDSNNESAIAEDDETDIPDGILSSFRDSCGTYALTWYPSSLSLFSIFVRSLTHYWSSFLFGVPFPVQGYQGSFRALLEDGR
jgi:hypothetical protein